MDRFEEQVRRYQDRVYGFACSLLDDREAAADVTQDVLICFWKRRSEISHGKTLNWLMRVTRNACIDVLRKRKTRRRLLGANTDSLEQTSGRQDSPVHAAEMADFRAHLQKALTRIDEPYRSVVILRELQELQYREISEVLDMPLNTVKVYLHRGRKRLRKQIAEVMDHEIA